RSLLTQSFQRSLQEAGFAGVALHFAAGGFGNSPGPEQYHRVDPRIVLFSHRSSNGSNHGLDIKRQTPIWLSVRRTASRRLIPGLDFCGDDELFSSSAIDRK